LVVKLDQEFRREKILILTNPDWLHFYPYVKTEMVTVSTGVKRGHYRYQNNFTVGEWIDGIAGPNGAVKNDKEIQKRA